MQRATPTFDPGSVLDLAAISLWQCSFGVAGGITSTLERGVKDFTVSTSLDGIGFADAFGGTLAVGTGRPLAAQSFTCGSPS